MHKLKPKLLKKDVFGEILLCRDGADQYIVRNAGAAKLWIRWLARWLLTREAVALAALDGVRGVPQLLRSDRNSLARSYMPGAPLHSARPDERRYFVLAARRLRQMHRAGVVHNDLAKEANILVGENGDPAIIDFQLAWFSRRRTRLFRVLGREDLRHLLKHKRTYCRQHLTVREINILDNPSTLSKIWMKTVKPVYLFVTRRLMRWSDREGAQDRHGH